jgi:uncharacterized membrane protein
MTSDNVARSRLSARQETVLWLAIAGILAAAIGFSWNPIPLAQVLAAIFIAGAVVHPALPMARGAPWSCSLLAVQLSLRWKTWAPPRGFPFGVYRFEVDADLPHVGLIPIIVGPLWFGTAYFSWTVAWVLLDGAGRQLDHSFNLVALPVVAALVVTQWDLVMDAPNAIIAKVWIWHDGGGVFGVPLTNYLGWLLTSWLIFQAFALYLRRSRLRPIPRMSRKLPATGILFYVSAGLTHIVPLIMGPTGEAVDARGMAGRSTTSAKPLLRSYCWRWSSPRCLQGCVSCARRVRTADQLSQTKTASLDVDSRPAFRR